MMTVWGNCRRIWIKRGCSKNRPSTSLLRYVTAIHSPTRPLSFFLLYASHTLYPPSHSAHTPSTPHPAQVMSLRSNTSKGKHSSNAPQRQDREIRKLQGTLGRERDRYDDMVQKYRKELEDISSVSTITQYVCTVCALYVGMSANQAYCAGVRSTVQCLHVKLFYLP